MWVVPWDQLRRPQTLILPGINVYKSFYSTMWRNLSLSWKPGHSPISSEHSASHSFFPPSRQVSACLIGIWGVCWREWAGWQCMCFSRVSVVWLSQECHPVQARTKLLLLRATFTHARNWVSWLFFLVAAKKLGCSISVCEHQPSSSLQIVTVHTAPLCLYCNILWEEPCGAGG